MSLTHSHNWVFKMDKDKIISLVERLKTLTYELENEIKPKTGSYVMNDDDYTEILKYLEKEDGVG